MNHDLGTLELDWPGSDDVFRIHTSSYNDAVARDIAAIRSHFDDVEVGDAIDPLSYHIVGYRNDCPITCIRVTLARDAAIENMEHYWKPALDLAYPHISSGGRFFMIPGSKVPPPLRDTFLHPQHFRYPQFPSLPSSLSGKPLGGHAAAGFGNALPNAQRFDTGARPELKRRP